MDLRFNLNKAEKPEIVIWFFAKIFNVKELRIIF